MIRSASTYYMPAGRLADAPREAVGEFGVTTEWAEAGLRFSLLDNFGQTLRRTRRILLRTGERLELLTGDDAVMTQAVPASASFVPEFGDGPVKDALADLSPLRALLPIASGTMRTGTLSLVDDEGKTCARAALRLLEPDAGKAVLLLVPRGLRGYDRALEALIANIRARGGVPLEAGNLYSLIDHTQGRYVAKPVIEINPEDTAFDTASRLIASYLPVARANEAGIVADIDTEFLHDYRVALRKIRSVLSLFKDVYDPAQTLELKTRFSMLMAPSGALRDLDVYLLEKGAFYDLVPDSMHGGLDAMFDLMAARRTKEHAILTAHLRTQGYEKEMKALSKLFSKRKKLLPGHNASRSSRDLARELIWKRYKRIRRVAFGLDESTPDADVHRLRIECKKLRYLMEFFGPLFPPEPFADLLKPLKRLQDTLGLFNDHSVQQASLRSFAEALGKEPRRLEIAQSVGALVTVLHHRQGVLREKILEAFARFTSDRTQGAFSALFHDVRRA